MPNRGHWAGLGLAAPAIACASVAGANETIDYSYDSLGRLVQVEHRGAVNNGVKAAYSYDLADNRTNVTVGGAPSVAGGGFEAPDAGVAHFYQPAGGPADFAGNSGIAGNHSVWGFAAAPEGRQVAFIQSYGTASAVSLPVTGLTPGQSYTVRFRIALRPGFGANPVTVTFGGAGLGTFTPDSTAFGAVVSAAFTASASSGTLTFTGSASAADLVTGLDQVTVAIAGSN